MTLLSQNSIELFVTFRLSSRINYAHTVSLDWHARDFVIVYLCSKCTNIEHQINAACVQPCLVSSVRVQFPNGHIPKWTNPENDLIPNGIFRRGPGQPFPAENHLKSYQAVINVSLGYFLYFSLYAIRWWILSSVSVQSVISHHSRDIREEVTVLTEE